MFSFLKRRSPEAAASSEVSTRDVISEQTFPAVAIDLLTLYQYTTTIDGRNGTTYAARMRELFRQLELEVSLMDFLYETLDSDDAEDRAHFHEVTGQVDQRLRDLHEQPEAITAGIDAVDEAFATLEEIGDALRASGYLALEN